MSEGELWEMGRVSQAYGGWCMGAGEDVDFICKGRWLGRGVKQRRDMMQEN